METQAIFCICFFGLIALLIVCAAVCSIVETIYGSNSQDDDEDDVETTDKE